VIAIGNLRDRKLGLRSCPSGQSGAYDIAVDATTLYWTNEVQSGTVVSIPLAGGTPVTLVSGRSFPMAVAEDATSLYWTEQGANIAQVMKLTPK
jgi:hypothetical protein